MKNNRLEKAARYIAAGNLNGTYRLLNPSEKKYTRYLVTRYAYPVKLAIQTAYIIGFDKWPYDYRAGVAVREDRARGEFWGRK